MDRPNMLRKQANTKLLSPLSRKDYSKAENLLKEAERSHFFGNA